MQFAGFAKAARGLFVTLSVLAGWLASSEAGAQTTEAQGWYSQGVKALDEHRYADARAALLKAIEADPTFAGAWLDLALTAQAEGDSVQAEEFLTILEARFTLPAPIAAGVKALRQRILAQRAKPGPGWHWHAVFQGGGGRDSNANAGLALSNLTLTVAGGQVALPLAAALQPQADSYALASLAAEGSRSLDGGGQLEAAASAKSRVNSHLREFDTVETQVALAYGNSEPAFDGRWSYFLPGPWRLGVTAQQLRLGGRALLHSLQLSAQHGWKSLPCGPRGGIEVDIRHFPVAPNLDSRLFWLSSAASCDSPWIGTGGRLNAQFRAGMEVAKGDFFSSDGRPGGNTRHLELTLAHQWSWPGRGGTHRLETQAQWAHAKDTRGYSPLLADNVRRTVTRASAGVAYTLPLESMDPDGRGWVAVLALQGFRQRSNLEVFRLKGEVGQVTLQKAW